MILILGHAGLDPSTESVQDWIYKLGGRSVRVNGEDVFKGRLGTSICMNGTGGTSMELGDIPIDEIKVVWYRRWMNYASMCDSTFEHVCGLSQPDLFAARSSIIDEARQFSRLLFDMFGHCRWLPNYRSTALSKLAVLRMAAEFGLRVPVTIATNQRSKVVSFWKEMNCSIITKPMYQIFSYTYKGIDYSHHTYAIETQADIDKIHPKMVFPSLFQERVHKKYEIRSFYLMGIITSIAIFSQNSKRTEVDFRLVNDDSRMHSVPYELPAEIEGLIRKLMEKLDLTTGSIDMIRSIDGGYVFLEINPLGQFGMTSVPAGANLERQVAEHLIRMCK